MRFGVQKWVVKKEHVFFSLLPFVRSYQLEIHDAAMFCIHPMATEPYCLCDVGFQPTGQPDR